MVNDINGIGFVPTRSLGQAGSSPPTEARSITEFQPPARREVEVTSSQRGFIALANAKDEALRVAQSVRQADRGLGQVGELLQGMRQEAETLLKIYPPYPPGSERRVEYLNSINGLRQQLEAMTFPTPEEGESFVFYPRELDLPSLDPITADDGDVADFVTAIGSAQVRVFELGTELKALVEGLPGHAIPDMPIPPKGESEAQTAGRSIADQIRQAARPLLGDSQALIRLGA